mmetsp:Transcript_72974/g.188237  ORF Transcript_72974/g.188237 Transcript_72974/m.188237 type:complete len:218 (-) Transcript_72974:118-771(-)
MQCVAPAMTPTSRTSSARFLDTSDRRSCKAGAWLLAAVPMTPSAFAVQDRTFGSASSSRCASTRANRRSSPSKELTRPRASREACCLALVEDTGRERVRSEILLMATIDAVRTRESGSIRLLSRVFPCGSPTDPALAGREAGAEIPPRFPGALAGREAALALAFGTRSCETSVTPSVPRARAAPARTSGTLSSRQSASMSGASGSAARPRPTTDAAA